LVKSPEQRLGFKSGFREVKIHPFFKGVDWELVLKKDPKVLEFNEGRSPIRPHLMKSYFD